MRTPKYLSPTSVSKFFSDRTEFYLNYLADNRPPRLPQTRPMSVGSAFDAFAKNYLVYNLYGKVPEQFEIENIFEQQVEPQNRDWALEHGEKVFQQYEASGALADLMIELQNASEEPRFEFTVESRVSHETRMDGIPLLGKPDIFFITKEGAKVIYDWKVNGYCGRRNISPRKGYLKCRDGWDETVKKHSRSHNSMHKDCQPMQVQGVTFNVGMFLEEIDESWAAQTCIYLWILGEEIGTKAIAGIEQLCAMPRDDGDPLIRVASHRARIAQQFQLNLYGKIQMVWEAIESGYIFTDMTREESDARCKILDDYYKAYETQPDGNQEDEDWFASVTRSY